MLERVHEPPQQIYRWADVTLTLSESDRPSITMVVTDWSQVQPMWAPYSDNVVVAIPTWEQHCIMPMTSETFEVSNWLNLGIKTGTTTDSLASTCSQLVNPLPTCNFFNYNLSVQQSAHPGWLILFHCTYCIVKSAAAAAATKTSSLSGCFLACHWNMVLLIKSALPLR